jgi:phosphoglycolate phosphatase
MRVPVEEAVMIGDTEFDMEMARRADMPRIAVDYGAHHISRLKPYQPALCVSDIRDVLQFSLR